MKVVVYQSNGELLKRMYGLLRDRAECAVWAADGAVRAVNPELFASLCGFLKWEELAARLVHMATQRRYRRFLLSLRRVLPCRHCRENYASNLRDSGFGEDVLASRDAFSQFVFDLHERVNTMLGKTSGLTYARVRDRYENFRSRCLHDPTEAAQEK